MSKIKIQSKIILLHRHLHAQIMFLFTFNARKHSQPEANVFFKTYVCILDFGPGDVFSQIRSHIVLLNCLKGNVQWARENKRIFVNCL